MKKYIILLLTLPYFYCEFTHKSSLRNTIDNPQEYQDQIKKLIEELDTDFTKYWTYKDLFNKPEHLGVSSERVQRALTNLGNEKRLKRLLIKALNGEKIRLVTIGGSITKGAPFAEKGNGYRVYFNAIRNWWNRIFTPLTRSRMASRSISIGGVGTDYFSYCLNTHLREDDKPKLILWELSANDRGRYDDKPFPTGQPLEQFTRNVLNRISQPALLYIHFFRGHDYLDGKCKNLEGEGGDVVARHYNIASISWRNFVCQSMKDRVELFLAKNTFSYDQLHPSILGHAQMAFLIINHLKNSFLRMLKSHALNVPSLALFQQQTLIQGDITLLKPLYHETTFNKPLCFTYFRYNDYEPNNTLAVNIIRHDDFKLNIFKKFKIRTDKLGGMQTYLAEQLLQVAIQLPAPYARLVAITHAGTGNGQVWLDQDTPVLINSDKYTMGSKVDLITTNVNAGNHTLNVLSMKNGFAFCGIAVL